jgi:inner membrane protein
MDSLTQIVLGASVGEIVGTIPDLDVLLKPFISDIHQLAWHRGFSHSIVFFVLLSIVLGWGISKIYKGKRGTMREWAWFVWWVAFTHALLDCFTTWGTQLFWPLPVRVAFNNIFVADPLYTIPFLLCIVILMFFRRSNPWRSKVNYTGLALSSTYMLFTIASKMIVLNQAVEIAESIPKEIIEISSKPTPLNAFLWSIQVKTDEGFYLGYSSLLDTKKEIDFYFVEQHNELLTPYQHFPEIELLMYINNGYYTVEETETGIQINDVRFGQPLAWENPDAPFIFAYDASIKNQELTLTQLPIARPTQDQMPKIINYIWTRIKGN